MNIQALTPKFLHNNVISRSNQNNLNAGNTSYSNLKPLGQDTVSFGANTKFIVGIPQPTIGDLISRNYEESQPFLQALSTRLMDTMEAIARELADIGLIFDRAYNERAPIKSTDSYMSKFRRSGSMPKDRVRATWYNENLHDVSLLVDRIFPALESRGYKIAYIPGRKKIPDFDIRLSGVPERAKNVLPEHLRDVASFKEQGSGYGDIQFRIIDTTSGRKGKIPLEIIIVAGKNTAKAKSDESYYVYDITRVLKNELHVSEIVDPEVNTPAYRIKNNIGIITNSLNGNISKPLFHNAKKLDIEHDQSQLLPVRLDEDTCQILPGVVEGINTKISLHYSAKIKEVKQDTTLSSAEKKERIAQLEQYKKDDLHIIQMVKERLAETIEKFGVKSKQ